MSRALGDREGALKAADELISLQGVRATSRDLSDLNESLELYERMVSAWEEENASSWQRNLEKLGHLAGAGRVTPDIPHMETAEADYFEEESIPILKVDDTVLREEEEELPEEDEAAAPPEEDEAVEASGELEIPTETIPEDGGIARALEMAGDAPTGDPPRESKDAAEPEAALEPAADPEPPPAPEPEPEATPEAALAPELEPTPTPESDPGPESGPTLEPVPAPEPEAVPEAKPELAPQPAPVSPLDLAPQPAPVSLPPVEEPPTEAPPAEEPRYAPPVERAVPAEAPMREPEPAEEPVAEEPSRVPSPSDAEGDESAVVPPVDPTLRTKLRGMIQRVREQLGDTPRDAPQQDVGLSRQAELFRYLMRLAGNLPPNRDWEYRRSEERLKLLGVHARLSGRGTLRSRASRVEAPRVAASPRGGAVGAGRDGDDAPRPSETMRYLASLSGHLDDPEVAGQLTDRARAVGERLSRIDH